MLFFRNLIIVTISLTMLTIAFCLYQSLVEKEWTAFILLLAAGIGMVQGLFKR